MCINLPFDVRRFHSIFVLSWSTILMEFRCFFAANNIAYFILFGYFVKY